MLINGPHYALTRGCPIDRHFTNRAFFLPHFLFAFLQEVWNMRSAKNETASLLTVQPVPPIKILLSDPLRFKFSIVSISQLNHNIILWYSIYEIIFLSNLQRLQFKGRVSLWSSLRIQTVLAAGQYTITTISDCQSIGGKSKNWSVLWKLRFCQNRFSQGNVFDLVYTNSVLAE